MTRAVRVVDLITNLDMAAFQAQGGLFTFINRLEVIGKASVYQVYMYFSHLHHMICFSPTKKLYSFHACSYIKINTLSTLDESEYLSKNDKKKNKKLFNFFILKQNRNVNID